MGGSSGLSGLSGLCCNVGVGSHYDTSGAPEPGGAGLAVAVSAVRRYLEIRYCSTCVV